MRCIGDKLGVLRYAIYDISHRYHAVKPLSKKCFASFVSPASPLILGPRSSPEERGHTPGLVLSSVQVGEAALERGQHRLGSVGGAELVQYVVNVKFDRALAHRERRRDLLVALALRQLLHDVELARGKIGSYHSYR